MSEIRYSEESKIRYSYIPLEQEELVDSYCPECKDKAKAYCIFRSPWSDRYCEKNHQFHDHQVEDAQGNKYVVFASVSSRKLGNDRMDIDSKLYPYPLYSELSGFRCMYCMPPVKHKVEHDEIVGYLEPQKPRALFDKTTAHEIRFD